MIVERIENADLPAATYRTARRLLDLADDRGAVKLPHERMRAVVGTDADSTVRRHLVELQGAGIIAYRRNSEVQVWFADWQPGNVISSDQHGSAVISGDQYTRENEQRSVISSDQYARNSRAQRSNRAHTDHLPHTHASTRLNERTDPIQSTENSSFIPPNPEAEQAQAYALLREVKVIQSEAATLAASCPFERVRDCVAAWWMNRKSMGGKLKDGDPAIVVYWLKEWPRVEPNPFDERAWRREELYMRYRTAAELSIDTAPGEDPPALPPPVVAQSPPAYLDDDPGWLAVAADPGAAGELAGLVAVDAVDGVPLYRLRAKDPAMAQLLDNRMAARLQKVIKGAVGYPVLVRIIGADDGKCTG